jgi:hypothetical protein
VVAKSLNPIIWYMEPAIVAKEHHRELGSLIISKAGGWGEIAPGTGSSRPGEICQAWIGTLDRDDRSARWPRFRFWPFSICYICE